MAKKVKKKTTNTSEKASSQKKNPHPHSFFSNRKLHCLILIIAAIGLYVNTLGHEFTQDDAIVITDNMFTQEGLSGIPGLLKYDTFYGFFKESGKEQLVEGGRYRPFTLMMFALEWQLFGKAPFVNHLVNILLYGFLAFMVYQLLMILFVGEKKSNENLIWLAFIASAIYIFHPIHTEAIANIKGRDELMAMLGATISLWSIFKYRVTAQFKWWILACLSFFIALMSKENPITFLAVVPLAIFLFQYDKKEQPSLVLSLLPFIISAVIFLIIRYMILGEFSGGQTRELMNNPFLKIEGNKYVDFSLNEKFGTILFTLGKYIGLLFFPHPLTHDYYPRAIDIMTFGDWQVLLSLAIYIGLLITTFYFWKRDKIIVFGILFYLITLSIVSNVFISIGTNMSERFMFMPSLGFAIVIGRLITKYIKNKNLQLGLIAIILLGFSLKTVTRNAVWVNNFTLFTTDVKTSTRSAKLLNAAGGELSTVASKMDEGPKKTEYLNKAINYLNQAVRIHPNYRNAYLLMANSHYFKKDYENAVLNYDRVLTISPGYQDAHQNLLITLREGSRYVGQYQQNYQLAEKWLRRGTQLDSKDYEMHRLLGITLGVQGRHGEAIPYFQKAIELRPDVADNYTSLGTAYKQMGDIDKAREMLNKAVEIDPNALNRLSKTQ